MCVGQGWCSYHRRGKGVTWVWDRAGVPVTSLDCRHSSVLGTLFYSRWPVILEKQLYQNLDDEDDNSESESESSGDVDENC